MKKLKCIVIWNEFMPSNKSDIITKTEFEKSILGYINMFKSLPPIGLLIDNSNTDTGKIIDISFNGIESLILVELEVV